MNHDTYIIIPVYNEDKVIRKVVEEVRRKYEHVICINDGSSDRSAHEIKEAGAVLVDHPINLGQGAALQTGIEYALQFANAKYFVTFDADGQHRLKDVDEMLKVIKAEKLDMVLGSRFMGAAENISALRRVVLKMAIVFSNFTTGVRLTDAHNGLRVFNRHAAERLKVTMPDMAHASEIIHRIAEEKFAYKEVPIVIAYTDYSRAKGQSLMNAINITFDLMLRRMSRK